jgi:hypothetical protein
MRDESPFLEPVRTPLGWPVSSDLLAPFCHPQSGHAFSLPFTINGTTYAANGWLALKLDKPEPKSFRPHPNPRAETRLAGILPEDWRPRGAPIDMDHERGWRRLDEKGGAIWKLGPIPFWVKREGKWNAAPDPRVIVGCRSIPLALIQLIARLPRAEIWTCNPLDCRMRGSRAVPFRFNGGCGVIANWKDGHAGERGWHLFGYPSARIGPLGSLTPWNKP